MSQRQAIYLLVGASVVVLTWYLLTEPNSDDDCNC